MKSIRERFWGWPDGLLWQATARRTLRAREEKFRRFMELIVPRPGETILDAGVAPYSVRGTNFLESLYPFPEQITALSNDSPERFRDFATDFPRVRLIFGDARRLDFPDGHFDIAFSNAVVEHVGERAEQQKFVSELLRVAGRVFLTTPNYWFPVDSHTLVPLAHWLPFPLRRRVYRLFGVEEWARPSRLNLLSAKQFLSLFPDDAIVKIYRQRISGMTSNLIAVAVRKQRKRP